MPKKFITPDEKAALLTQFGFDPKSQWVDDEGNVVDMADKGATMAGLTTALYDAPKTVLGFAGGAAGAGAAGALGLPSGPGALAAGVAGAVGGSELGNEAGDKLQDWLYPDSWKLAAEARRARHALASGLGNLGENLLLMRPSPTVLKDAGKAAMGLARTGEISAREGGALGNVLLGGGIGGGQALASGGSPGEVLQGIATGALMHQPTKAGTLLSGGVFQPHAAVPSLAEAGQSLLDAGAARKSELDSAIAEHPWVQAGAEELAKQRAELQAIKEKMAAAEAARRHEEEKARARAHFDDRARELGLAAPEPARNPYIDGLVPQVEGVTTTGDRPAIPEQGVSAPTEGYKPQDFGSIAPDAVAEPTGAKAPLSDLGTKVRERQSIEGGPGRGRPGGIDAELGTAPSSFWNKFWESFDRHFGVRTKYHDEIVGPDGRKKAGYTDIRPDAQTEATINISDKGALSDTQPHERTHQFLADMLRYGSPRQKKYVRTLLEKLGHPVDEAGNIHNEEALVQSLGEDVVERAVDPEKNKARQDIADYLGTMFRRGEITPAQARRMLSARLLYGKGTSGAVEIAPHGVAQVPKQDGEPIGAEENRDTGRTTREEFQEARDDEMPYGFWVDRHGNMTKVPWTEDGGHEPMARQLGAKDSDDLIARGYVRGVRSGNRRYKFNSSQALTPAQRMAIKRFGEDTDTDITHYWGTEKRGEQLNFQRREQEAREEGPVFSTDFEKELAKPRPWNIQVSAKDGRMSARDVGAAVKKLSPTEQTILKEAGLGDFLSKVVRPNAAELKAWAEENVPRVEVKKLGADSPTNELESKAAALRHELDTRFPDGPTTRNLADPEFNRLSNAHALAALEASRSREYRANTDNDSATRRFDSAGINPRKLKDMPGAVDLLVRYPRKERTTEELARMAGYTPTDEMDAAEFRNRNFTAEQRKAPTKYSSSHYPQSGDNLLAHVRAYEHTMPNGEKVLRVFEVQSDWAQARRKDEKLLAAAQNDSQRNVLRGDRMTPDDPLLAHHQRLALKAAIEHARSRGINKVVVDDAETAMLTEGHDRVAETRLAPGLHWVTYNGRKGQLEIDANGKSAPTNDRNYWHTPLENGLSRFDMVHDQLPKVRSISQEKGMRLAYDNVLQQHMRDLAGEGTRVELGEHRNAFEGGPEDHSTQPRRVRPDLIFRNPDGTPKITSTGFAYDVSAPQARRAAGEPFSYTGRRYQGAREEDFGDSYSGRVETRQLPAQVHTPEFKNWFGNWQRVKDLNAARARGEDVDNGEALRALRARSAVVDDDGNPMVVYHGTKRTGLGGDVFNTFDPDKTTEMGMHFGTPAQAGEFNHPHKLDFELTQDEEFFLNKEAASAERDRRLKIVSPRTYPVYLDIKNPLVTPDVYSGSPGKFLDWARDNRILDDNAIHHATLLTAAGESKRAWEAIKTAIKDQGYDGIKYKNELEGKVKDPTNIAWIAFDPAQVKSATGNRGTFDRANPDIRYQDAPEFGPRSKTSTIPDRELEPTGVWTGTLDRLRKSGNAEKSYLADKFDELYHGHRAMQGDYAKVPETMRKLDAKDQQTLTRYMIDAKRARKEDLTKLPARLRTAAKTLRAELRRMAQDQIDDGQRLSTGEVRGIDPFYYPEMPDPSVTETIRNEQGTERFEALKRDYIGHNTREYQKRGFGLAQAKKKATEAFDKTQQSLTSARVGNALDFGAVTEHAGTSLPDSWLAEDQASALRRYVRNFTKARAKYNVLERDERAMKALGEDYYFDKNGNRQDIKDPSTGVVDQNVKHLLDEFIGNNVRQKAGPTGAVSRLVSTAILANPVTRLTDAANTLFKGLAYARPGQFTGLIKNLADLPGSWERMHETGWVQRGRHIVSGEMVGATQELVNKLDTASHWLSTGSGSEHIERGGRALAQNIGEYLGRVNRTLAKAGNKESRVFLEKVSANWEKLSDAELGTRIGQLMQGRYDATNLPPWISNTIAQPFFSMMRWNVEQWNNFKKFAIEPARRGDFAPMVAQLVAGVAGGLFMKELREALSGRKARVATLKELAEAKDGTAQAIEGTRYAVNLMQLSGTLGVVSEIGSWAADIAGKEAPQGVSIPAYSLGTQVFDRLRSAGVAIMDGTDPAAVLPELAKDLARENFSMARFLENNAGRAGLWDAAGNRLDEANLRRDNRMAAKLLGEHVQRTPLLQSEYETAPDRAVDSEKDPQKMREMASARKADIRKITDKDERARQMRAAAASRISYLPSKENDPKQYRAHLDFVERTQGPEAAQALRERYAADVHRAKMRRQIYK